MDDHLRRGIAYIAARLRTGRDESAIYDFEAGNHFFFAGTVGAGEVAVTDLARGTHLGGSGETFTDFDTGEMFSIELKGDDLSAYDFKSGDHAVETVDQSGSVSLHDLGNEDWFSYSI